MEYNSLFVTGVSILIVTNVIFFVGFIKYLVDAKNAKKDNQKIKEDFLEYKNRISIQDSKEVFEFLNDVIKVKFNYYLNVYFLANFASDKEIDKADIKKFKNDFYLDVSSLFEYKQKERLLKVFSQKGIELYIHQSFLRLFNDANITFKNGTQSNTVDSMNRNTMNAIYG